MRRQSGRVVPMDGSLLGRRYRLRGGAGGVSAIVVGGGWWWVVVVVVVLRGARNAFHDGIGDEPH